MEERAENHPVFRTLDELNTFLRTEQKDLVSRINDLLPPPYKVVYNAEKDLVGVAKHLSLTNRND